MTMNDVFVSYKREDEARIKPIVEGLRKAGLSVWWDGDLSAGLSWRQTISDQLDTSRCVIVIWSMSSVGSQGEFIHDEAWRAKARGVLLPVRIDRIREPIGFGEIQSLDLIGWQGDPRDPRFQNLLATTKAVVTGEPRPRPADLRRINLAALWGGVLSLSIGIFSFAAGITNLRAMICKAPGVRSMCVVGRFGGLPTPTEESMWKARTPGDCVALRTYLERFPNGYFAEEAVRRLQAIKVVAEEHWITEKQTLPVTVRTTFDPFANHKAARADALKRAEIEADRTCVGFNTGEYRFASASVEIQEWRCFSRGSGFVCGFDGQAICQVEVRRLEQREICK